MEIYKFKTDYAKAKWVHIQTVNKREKSWRLKKLTINSKKVWYIDVLDITKEFINNL